MATRKYPSLDEKTLYSNLDKGGMSDHLNKFSDLCAKAWKQSKQFNLPDDYKKVNRIIVLGMGGSAIGADMAGSYLEKSCRVPVIVSRDYDLPAYVDKDTLIIASSYSGTTEETLSAFRQALDTPSKKMALTTGGDLKKICEENEIPVLTFRYKAPPRAALPFSFFLLLGVLQNLGLVNSQDEAVRETVECLSSLRDLINEDVPTKENPAKAIAFKMAGKLPVIYGAGITSEVAHRWKTQINENSKAAAYWEVLPELNHNSVVGYEFPEQVKKKMLVVILDSNLIHDRVRKRIELTNEMLKSAGIKSQIIRGEGETELSQMISLTLFGDYVSYYLAALYQVDPTPVETINYLKQNLAKL